MGKINNYERSGMGTPYKGSPISLFNIFNVERTKVTDIGNKDVKYKKTTTKRKSGATTTKIKGDAYSDILGNQPGAGYPPMSREEMLKEAHSGSGMFTHVPRQPYMYQGKDKKVSIWSHRLKSKTSKEGVDTKRREKVVYDDGNQMKKVKQRVVRFGKNKGKIKHVTTHFNQGDKTRTKKYIDAIDTSPILKKK